MKHLLLLAALSLAPARADTIIALDSAAQTGSPGDTLIFTGMVSNTGLSTVFLNSANLNLAGNSFTPDFIDPFFNNVPVSLDAGQVTPDIELFEVLLNNPFTDTFGDYGGNYSLSGGVDANAGDPLASVDFTITAQSGSAAVPEPPVVSLVAVALAALAVSRSRYLAEIGRKGGEASGKARMEKLTPSNE